MAVRIALKSSRFDEAIAESARHQDGQKADKAWFPSQSWNKSTSALDGAVEAGAWVADLAGKVGYHFRKWMPAVRGLQDPFWADDPV